MSDYNNYLLNFVKKIRSEATDNNEKEQVDKYYSFFKEYPALFWMARDKTMDLKRFEWMLSLKDKINKGELDKDETDKAMGLMMFKEYVEPNIK
jgi:hypothetical protein